MPLGYESERLIWSGKAPHPSYPRSWVRKRACYYTLRFGKCDFLLWWRPHIGMSVVATCPFGEQEWSQVPNVPLKRGAAVKRRQIAKAEGIPLPAASIAGKTLVKFPRFLEHMTATAYDDGTIRVPGYCWLSTRGQAWILTLFDVDGCARLPLVANSVDEVFAMAEAMLGAEDAPWQLDQFMLDRSNQKKKKKSA